MKNKTINPTRSQFNILRQICNFIPPHEVSKIARATGVQEMSRTFKPWSHVVSLVYAQLTHSLGLNDLCDSLQLHSEAVKPPDAAARHRPAAIALPRRELHPAQSWSICVSLRSCRRKILEVSRVNVPNPSPGPSNTEDWRFMAVCRTVLRTRVVG